MNPNESKLPSDSLIKRYAHILYGVVHGAPGTDAFKYYDAINPAEKEGWERLARANLAGFPNLDEALDAWLEDQIAQRSATVQSFDESPYMNRIANAIADFGDQPAIVSDLIGKTVEDWQHERLTKPTVQAEDHESEDRSALASEMLRIASTGFGYDISDEDKMALLHAAAALDPKSVEKVQCGNHEVYAGHKAFHDRIVHGK